MKGRTISALGNSLPGPVKEAIAWFAIGVYRIMRRGATFGYRGKVYTYFSHPYNLAWRNERTVEIPIARDLLEEYAGRRVLEVGNVTSHYFDVHHDILDKYETGKHVISADVIDFEPETSYDLVLSVSTLEHVGWDETPREPGKAAEAVGRMASFLAPEGLLVATVPAGYNRELDRALEQGDLPFRDIKALKRTSRWNAWKEIPPAECVMASYDSEAATAQCVYVCYLEGRVPGGRPSEPEIR